MPTLPLEGVLVFLKVRQKQMFFCELQEFLGLLQRCFFFNCLGLLKELLSLI